MSTAVTLDYLTSYLTYREDAELLSVGNDELEPLWADVLDGAGGTLDWVLHRPATEGVHQHQASHGYHAHPAAHTINYISCSPVALTKRKNLLLDTERNIPVVSFIF